jgi:hypothetical protein
VKTDWELEAQYEEMARVPGISASNVGARQMLRELMEVPR